MAFSKNNAVDVIHEAQPKKIIIQTGPSFGTVLGFLLLGAAVGAAGAIYFKGKLGATKSAADPLQEGLTAGGAKDASALAERANAILRRVKSVASRARDTIHSASEAIAPAVQDAIKEAKNTASQTERDLTEELENAKES